MSAAYRCLACGKLFVASGAALLHGESEIHQVEAVGRAEFSSTEHRAWRRGDLAPEMGRRTGRVRR